MKRAVDPIIDQLRAERTRQGLSLERLSARCGWSVAIIGSYERGDRRPNLARIRVWADALGCELRLLSSEPSRDAPTRLEFAVHYGPNGDGEIDCDSRTEALALALHIDDATADQRVVRLGDWEAA